MDVVTLDAQQWWPILATCAVLAFAAGYSVVKR